jgi:hypothetical protein
MVASVGGAGTVTTSRTTLVARPARLILDGDAPQIGFTERGANLLVPRRGREIQHLLFSVPGHCHRLATDVHPIRQHRVGADVRRPASRVVITEMHDEHD